MKGKINFSDQKQYRKCKHQQNKINQKTKMGRKTTVRKYQATYKQNPMRENLNMTEKEA